MFWSAVFMVVLTACFCQQDSALVSPTQSSLTIPSSENVLAPLAVLICGIIPNTTDYNAQWTTPNGNIFSPMSSTSRFTVTDGDFFGGNFPQATALVIMRLSYLDSGNYTCSVTFTGGDNSGTVMSMIELTLAVELEAIVSPINVSIEERANMTCEMKDFIRPDSDFQWRRGEEIIEDGGRYSIIYTVGIPKRGQNGESQLGHSRFSTLAISDITVADEGLYTCFVVGTDQSADMELIVDSGQVTADSTAMAGTDTQTPNTETERRQPVFPLSAVGAIAAVLGFIVLVLIVLIVVVSCRRRRKRSAVTLDHLEDRELNENTAYDSTSNGGALHGGRLPKYARVDKHSMSPPPPLPARPSTNLSSVNSFCELENSPPGYETPLNIVVTSAEKSVTIDPYYDNPEDVKHHPLPNPPPKKRTYYDEIEFGEDQPFSPREDGLLGITTVPSPAVVLSGSLQRSTLNQSSPDFTYPSYNEELDTNTEHDYDQIYSEPLDPTMLRHEYEIENSNDFGLPYSAIYEDPQPLHDTLPLRVTVNNIVEVKGLGMGQFGNVILARTVGISMKDLKFSETDTDTSKSTLVAIKKLKNDADGSLMEVFEKEVKFMARLNHDNVIRLLGVCMTGESFIMMEYMENGDLNQFLQKQTLMPDTIAGLQDNEVTPIILLYIGVQMASGMHYLSSHRFVHRDLATRNCLVGRDFVVKISDFGMSRSLYESAYYRVQGTLILPIRWMACETFYGKFSVKSDAWAFGVALWEIYTLGKVDPYDTMSDEEVIADAIRGPDRRLPEKPRTCPQDVYDIMLRCWVHEPSMRADFGEIYSRLFMIYTRQAL